MHALPVIRFLFSLEYQSCLSSSWLRPIFSQGQNSPVFSHKQNLMVQMQSKDMAPRFGKKGKVNADEVRPIDWSPREIPFCGVSLCCGVLIYQLLRLHPLRSASGRRSPLSWTRNKCRSCRHRWPWILPRAQARWCIHTLSSNKCTHSVGYLKE